MKVVDMFGAGLPVCAVDYNCITELVTPGVTGLLFKDSQQLAQQLLQLLDGFNDEGDGQPSSSSQLAALREGVAKEQSQWRWQDNWQAVAAPVFAHYADAAGGGRRGAVGSSSGGASPPPPPQRKQKKVA